MSIKIAKRTFLITLPFILLLFVPFINQNEKGISFLKKNKVLLTGLFSIFGIYLRIDENIFTRFPNLNVPILIVYFNLQSIILFGITAFCLFFLYLKNYKKSSSGDCFHSQHYENV